MPDVNIIKGRGFLRAPGRVAHSPLKADRNLSYREFIRLVRSLWEEAHPDVPIRATQGKKFAKYPVIVYALEDRQTHSDEPKFRYREHIRTEDDNDLVIWGQRFRNIVSFTVITETDPELAEQIIELFEDFMSEYTPVFKRLGASEFIYARRLPDNDQNRVSEDVTTRAVAYYLTTEKLKQIAQPRLNELVIHAQTFIQRDGYNFTTDSGDAFLTSINHQFRVGDRVSVFAVQDADAASLPSQLHHSWIYEVAAVTNNTITITNLAGDAVGPFDAGQGVIILDDYNVPGDLFIDDNYQSATPSF